MVIPEHNYTVREKTVIDILNNYNGRIETFLNVGFRQWNDPRIHWWRKICDANHIDWKILEIFPNNVEDSIKSGCPKEKIQLGNILNIEEYGNHDVLLFWHGPEHIKKDVFLKALPQIESKVNKIVIFGMPLGHEPQGSAHGNPFEVHQSDWFEQDWKDQGYEVIPIHDHQAYPHITAYKILA